MSQTDAVCTRCGKVFTDNRTPEERLIDAIFYGVSCPACMKELVPESYCTKCEKLLGPDEAIYFNSKPYHTVCLPYGGQ